jgi:rhomboid family GlyGly-CTERM serine protease
VKSEQPELESDGSPPSAGPAKEEPRQRSTGGASPEGPHPFQVSGFRSQVSALVPIITVAVVALIIQSFPAARSSLIYERTALAGGDLWRIWTGHLVHFGWPHLVVDAGLWLIVGWFSARRHPTFTRWGIVLMPAFISGSIYLFEPGMIRYAGLSAVNLGLLAYLAVQGWRRDWTDWFWPAVLLAYVGELVWEYYRGGTGGGAIRFDDPGVRVATGAHLASAAYALLALGVARLPGLASRR